MRVLSAAVLGAVAAGAALVGCYDPQVADCQFVCGAGSACPDGTACMAGFCRVPGATGSCSAAASCPSAPCGAAGVPVLSGGCLALCSGQQAFDNALSMCGVDDGGSGWHIAILDTTPKRDEATAHFASTQAWVGLKRDSSLASWHWLNPAMTTVANTAPDWDSLPEPTQTAATFNTGKQKLVALDPSELEPYFCAYRP